MHFDAGLNSLFWAFFVHHFSINIFTSTQCDQIGQFFKVLGNKIASKRGQMIGNFLGYFEKPHSYAKTALGTFGQLLEKIGLLLIPTSGHTASKRDGHLIKI